MMQEDFIVDHVNRNEVRVDRLEDHCGLPAIQI